MKAWLFLIVAHVAICGVAAYLFQRRETTHVDHLRVTDTTAEIEVRGGGRIILLDSTHVTTTFPGPLILYAILGLLGLVIGGAIDLYAFLRPPPPAEVNHETKG